MIWRYLVPGVYHYRTRLRTPRVVLFWLVNVAGVIAVVSWFASGLAIAPFALVFVLALGAWQGIYEVGYLENDLVTTARERAPTLRLDARERTALLGRYPQLVATKTLVTIALIAALWAVEATVGSNLNLVAFVAWLVVLRLIYVAHNATRGRLAIVTFAFLQVAKYGAVPLLLLDVEALVPFLLIACTPVPMAVAEYAALPRFGFERFSRIMQPHPRARVAYFATLSVALGVATWVWPDPTLRFALAVALGLLAFRGAAWYGVWLAGARVGSAGARGRAKGVDDGA